MRARAALIRTLASCMLLAVLCAGTASPQTAPTPPDDEARAVNLPPPPVSPLLFTGYQGRTVHDIQFRGIQADERVLEHLRELVVQKADEPLDSRKIRSSILQLYATGRFSSLQVEAEQRPDAQLSVVFIADENFFIGQMTVDGTPKRPTATQLLDASKLTLGELFTPEKLQIAVQQMRTVLADNGYYQAEITCEQFPHRDTQQMELHFHIKPGAPAHIGQVIVHGSPGYTLKQLEDMGHLHPGSPVSSARLTTALQRLRKNYQKQRRLEAQIAVVNRIYHADTNQLDYVLEIERGPTTNIRVEGASISGGQLKKLVPVFEENAVDDDLLNEGRRNLRSYLTAHGYFDADVSVERKRQPDSDRLDIVYVVSRGDRHKLTDLVIDGNRYFPSDALRERMQVQPAGFLLSQGRFGPDLLARDVESLEALYRDNGFQQVKVTTEVNDNYQGDQNRVAVAVHVNEGPQTLVGKVSIQGNQSFSTDQFETLINTAPGQPYAVSTVAQDRDSVLSFYFNSGFPDVQLDATSKPEADDPQRVDVTYSITEGRRVFVDRVLVSGLEFTRPWVVERDMQVRRGDPLSQSNLYRTQAGFYDLGIFNEVDLAVQNPEGRSKYKDVVFQFQEAKRWTFNYGVGIEIQTAGPTGASTPAGRTGVSPRVSLDISRINLRGRNHTLTLHSNVGRLQQRGLISYDAPRWFNLNNLRMTFTLLYDNSLNVRTFTSQRFEGSVQALQTLTRRADGVTPVSSLLWSFTYRRVRATDLQIADELIPLLSQPVRVGMPGLTYIRDKRDNPIDSHKGNYSTFDGGYAAEALGSSVCAPRPAGSTAPQPATECSGASYGRFLIQNSTYAPFGRRNGYVFARSTRIGIEEPTGNTTVIPLPERFFAGGGSTLRGFGLNQAGPRDPETGFPIGGGAMFVNNFEMRFPPVILPWIQDNLSFVVFHDFGNVFERATDMFHSFGQWTQRNNAVCAKADPCSFNYMSNAVGTGFRYRTPIGPVRVDIGYNLNPPTFRTSTDPVKTETLGRFNFFFSIGQTF